MPHYNIDSTCFQQSLPYAVVTAATLVLQPPPPKKNSCWLVWQFFTALPQLSIPIKSITVDFTDPQKCHGHGCHGNVNLHAFIAPWINGSAYLNSAPVYRLNLHLPYKFAFICKLLIISGDGKKQRLLLVAGQKGQTKDLKTCLAALWWGLCEQRSVGCILDCKPFYFWTSKAPKIITS